MCRFFSSHFFFLILLRYTCKSPKSSFEWSKFLKMFTLNLLGWHWLIKSYRFQCTILWYMICTLHSVFTTKSWMSFCHHMFDPLLSLPPLPQPPFSLVSAILLSVSMSFCSFICLTCSVLYPTYEWNHMILDFFLPGLFHLGWYSQDWTMLLKMAVFHLFCG